MLYRQWRHAINEKRVELHSAYDVTRDDVINTYRSPCRLEWRPGRRWWNSRRVSRAPVSRAVGGGGFCAWAWTRAERRPGRHTGLTSGACASATSSSPATRGRGLTSPWLCLKWIDGMVMEWLADTLLIDGTKIYGKPRIYRIGNFCLINSETVISDDISTKFDCLYQRCIRYNRIRYIYGNCTVWVIMYKIINSWL